MTYLSFRLARRNFYPWIFLALIFGSLVFIQLGTTQEKIVEYSLTAIFAVGGFVHFLYSQHNSNTMLFVSLFEKFNARYDALNEPLNCILDSNPDFLQPKDRQVLCDYFNLCSEEYLFHKSGFIDKAVWESWLAGMNYFYQSPCIQKFWIEELKQNSYYGFNVTLFESKEKSK